MSTTMFLITIGIAMMLGTIIGAIGFAGMIYKKIIANKAYIVVESWDGTERRTFGNPKL